MRTKTQDSIDRRKFLEREKDLLYLHLLKLFVHTSLGQRLIDIEEVSRDASFRLACDLDIDVEGVSEELAKLFGAVVTTAVETRGDGCCEECYSEYDKNIFYVSSITKNWPTEALAALAPARRKTT